MKAKRWLICAVIALAMTLCAATALADWGEDGELTTHLSFYVDDKEGTIYWWCPYNIYPNET